jgi:DNA polymerase III subunit delta
MILFLHGKDTFRSRAQLHAMKEKFCADRDPQRLNVLTLDCQSESAEKILSEIGASPFLADKRMVIVEYLLSSPHESLRAAITAYVQKDSLPKTTVLVLWEDGTALRKKEQKDLLTLLKKQKYAQEFALLEGATLSRWIQEQVKKCGGEIEPDAVQTLMRHGSSDTWALHNIVGQLTSYCDGAPITSDAVLLFTEEKMDDNIFNLVDAILSQQPEAVFGMMREQYKSGKDAQYIFAMIVRQVRILLDIRSELDAGYRTGEKEMAEHLRLHPFVVKKSLPMVREYSFDSLKKIHAALLRVDEQSKTGGGDYRVLLDVCVGQLITEKANA